MRYVLSAFLLVAPFAYGEDLEHLLDSSSSSASGAAKRENSTPSPLFYVLTTLLPDPTADQSLFLRHIEGGDWEKALIQYPVAFEGKPFQKTANGRALFALAHLKAGMPVTGLELLFNAGKPREIHPEIRRLWKEAVPESHPAWTVAQVKWSPEFAEIFSTDVEFRVLARESMDEKDPAVLQKLFNRFPSNSPERGRLGWRLTLAYAANNKVEEAGKVLAQVMKSTPAPVSVDLMNITAARLLYQRGFFNASVKYYEKVSRTSEYWPDTQEEIAWAYLRRGEPQNAIAVSKSLMIPNMTGLASAESSFVHSLGQLKVCDYAGVLNTLSEFPKRFKARSEQLKRLSTSSENAAVKRVVEELKKHKISTQWLGKDGQSLPRSIARDERLYRLAQELKILEAEARAAESAFVQTMNITGLQGYFEGLKAKAMSRAHRASADSQSHIRQAAAVEAEEIKGILRKLHIVEAEIIQQMYVSENAAGSARGPVGSAKGSTGSKSKDTVRFKADQEIWLDEIGNYRLDVKTPCARGKRGRAT